jgi:hypothetical protein
LAKQLVAGIKQNYRLETYCLSVNSSPTSCEGVSPSTHAVIEALRQDDEAPAGMVWISAAALESQSAFLAADEAVVRNSLADLNRHIAEPEVGPFARPGWIDELRDWVREQIDPLGVRLTGKFQQFNASPTFSLIRIETTGAAVWFKATGEPNAHERPISIALHRFFPNYVPRILGVHPIWNGWLTEEAPGSTLDDLPSVRAWVEAARALAELQIASVAKTQVLLESECKDLRVHELARQIEPFLTRVRELMAKQTKHPPPILTDSEIDVLGDGLRKAFSELEQYRLPYTLGHLDPNPRNIIVSPESCCFLDWAEGCVTHPLFTFEYFREHSQRCLPQTNALTEKLVAAYIEPWKSFVSPNTLRQAMSISPLLAVFACAVADKRWHYPETLCDPSLAGFFRSLARRAHREAVETAARSDRCLV